jgi:hypothetical protein
MAPLQLSVCVWLLTKYLFDILLQRWQIGTNNLPDELGIHLEIRMDQPHLSSYSTTISSSTVSRR